MCLHLVIKKNILVFYRKHNSKYSSVLQETRTPLISFEENLKTFPENSDNNMKFYY